MVKKKGFQYPIIADLQKAKTLSGVKKSKLGAFKPFYDYSKNSGLKGLGVIAPDVEELVNTSNADIDAILNKLEKTFIAKSDIFSFDDNDLLYNKGITKAQKQAWVYYKRSYLKIPMLGGWKKYYLKGNNAEPFGTQDELFELVKQRALFYSDGNYYPIAVFTWGNIYDKEAQLLRDKDFIISEFGDGTYNDHMQLLQNAKPKLIRVDDPNVSKRAIIYPISTLAKTFRVKELRPEYMKEVNDSTQVDYKGRKFDKKKVINLDFDDETYYPIREVYVKWLYTLDIKRYFTSGVGPFEVSNFYVYGYPMSKDYKESSPLSEFEVRQRAQADGERLFSLFLNEVLVESDIEKLNYAFNAKYNAWADLNYSAIPIGLATSSTFLNQGFAIRPEKREAIAYMEAVGSGILAYDVGVGKTVSALLELANALHQGKCTRPMLVVPNPTYKNWIKEAMGGVDKETGEKFNGILTGLGYKVNDWYNLGTDIIGNIDFDKAIEPGTITFLTYEGMAKIGFTDKLRNDLIPQFVDILDQRGVDPTLESKPSSIPSLNGFTKEEIEASAEFGGLGKTARDGKKQEKDVAELLGQALENTICEIDNLKIDYIIIDEAHRCKKVFTSVKSDEEDKSDYTLNSGSPSSTGLKAFCLCNYIQRTYGRNVMLLTATPFTNSPLEVYSMLSLVGYDLLVANGYYNINDFFKQFANKSTEYVVTTTGEVKPKQIIKGFNNRLILQKLIFTKVNYKTGEDVGVKRPCKINLPILSKKISAKNDLKGLGNIERKTEQVLTYLEMNDKQAENQEYIINQINNAMSKGGKPDLKAMLQALNASLDNALSPFLFKLTQGAPPLNAKEFVDESPKIKYVMECVKSVKKYHEAKGEPVSGQVIYANRGVDFFPLIKKYLTEEVGFKAKTQYDNRTISEVMIIDGGTPQNDREWIKDAFNDGVVKVIIGSSTIREGINLQKTGTCLYDMYPDWNPTDVRQLEGRIWRQGNKFGYVRIVMPLVESSMDVFVFQKLEEKTARINDLFFREGTANVLDLDSIDPNEIKYALIKDISQLVKIDFSIERDQAKTAVELLAEDAEAIKNLQYKLKDLDKEREDAITSIQNEALEKIESYVKSLLNQDQDDKEIKSKLKYAQTLLFDVQQFLSKKDDEALMRFGLRFENFNNRVGYSFQLWRTRYNVQSFATTLREVKKAERTILKPKGFSLENNFEQISLEVQKEFEEKKAAFDIAYGAGNDERSWPEAKRYQELFAEIVAKKEALKVNGQPPEQRAKEFAALNYLLDYKAKQVTSGQCAIPAPGEAPPMPLTCPPINEKGERRIDKEGFEMLAKCIEAEPNTKLINTGANGRYTDTRLMLHEKIISETKGNAPCKVQNQPIAILTGGAPGSGKSTFIKKFASWMDDGTKVVKIDADAIRAKLPEYKGWNAFNTHAETKDIVNRLLEDVGNPCEHDIIYDGTMNKADNYRPLIEKLRGLGYKIFIIYIEVPKKVSIERAMGRYQRSGRYVPLEVIDEVFDKGLTAYEQLIKEADGYIRVDGMTQKIVQKGGLSLPKERNYNFEQDMSDVVVTPKGETKSKTNLTLYKYKAKAIALKLKMSKA
jgi:predicted ABC-type ATPase